MPILIKEDYQYALPEMFKVRQIFNNEKLEDIEGTVIREFQKSEISSKIKPGMNVALAVGSRGIKNLTLIISTVISQIKKMRANPFIVSAMGSHGGGTQEGQKKVLEGYGITEENLGVKVITTVDVVKLGETQNGIPVYFDTQAYGADLIIPINRIKLHTDFVGPLQSGLCKMLVIGLGNHKGCSSIHEEKSECFAKIIEEAAKIILSKTKVGAGLAIMENAYDETTHIEAIPRETFVEREKELVKRAKENMPFIRIEKADVLVVEEIGKDISGAGYDPNILGRSCVLKTFVLHVPKIQRMVLLNITEASHGNAIGLGQFDVITKNIIEKIDYETTYANAIACKCLDDAKIPIMVDTEEEAIRVALRGCRNIDLNNLKIVKIKNTLSLEYIEVSKALLEEVKKNKNLELANAI